MIDEETKLKNYNLFLKKLNKIGINTDELNSQFSSKIANASFSVSNESENAYDGSLLATVLRVLTPYAVRINEMLPENLKQDTNSIVKVCLLSHLSKCLIFEKNDNQWEVEKRGFIYKYKGDGLALKMGMRSLLMCQKLNIGFTDNEVEAMIIIDRTADDKQSEFYSSTLATIVKQANELTHMDLRMKGNH